MTGRFFWPIILVAVGVFAFFAGDAISNTEESVANSIGGVLSNKWLAGGVILLGAFWFATVAGVFKKL